MPIGYKRKKGRYVSVAARAAAAAATTAAGSSSADSAAAPALAPAPAPAKIQGRMKRKTTTTTKQEKRKKSRETPTAAATPARSSPAVASSTEADSADAVVQAPVQAPALAELAMLGIAPNEPGMGVPVELRIYRMFMELGIRPAAAKALIKDQYVTSMDTLKEMSEEQITILCKLIRRPGGSVEQPLAGVGRNANRTQLVAAYGAHIAIIHEINLKLARFYLKYKEMTSRTVEPEEVTVRAIKELRSYKVILEKKMMVDLDVDLIPNLTHERTLEWFDEFREFLDTRIGATSMRPLAYVVRAREAVKPAASDPATRQPGSIYQTYAHEIRERAPIKQFDNTLDRHFAADNAAVWKILWMKLKKGKYQSYIKPFLAKQDARGAFMALHDQLLDRAAIANYANAAENRLTSLFLDGTKTKNWNFDKYLVQHMEQHLILNKLKDFGYAGIDENSKIHYFMRGITDPAYESVHAVLATSPKQTFVEVVESFRTYINGRKARSGRYYW